MRELLFVPITKVDVEKREVWGRAVQEVADKSGEIFDYASSKPLFESWSAEFEKSTAGKSKGNIRAMHGSVAAGKAIAVDFRDSEKAIDIGTKIIDDAEWQKCIEGVYTGFSIGGSYAKRWQDTAHAGLTRYTAKPAEISLVDNPCVPTATFALVKADGTAEERTFKIAARSDTSPKEGEDKYGDVTFADAKNKKYPIDTAARIRAAWNYINKPANAGKYSSADAARIKANIVRAWKKHIDPKGPPSAAKKLHKGLYAVSSFADLLGRVMYLQQSAAVEAFTEGDDSEQPAQLKAWLAQGCTLLEAMVEEECAEMFEDDDAMDEPDDSTTTTKATAMPATADTALVTKVEDPKVVSDVPAAADLAKMVASIEALQKSVATLTAEKDAMAARVKELEAEPADAKPVLKVIAKDADTTDDVKEEPVDPKDPEAAFKLMKRALAKPIAMSLR